MINGQDDPIVFDDGVDENKSIDGGLFSRHDLIKKRHFSRSRFLMIAPLWLLRLINRLSADKKIKGSQAWMDYYATLRLHPDQELPPPYLFSRMVSCYGFFFVPNPFQDGNPLRYGYCADGVTLDDVDVVLQHWLDHSSLLGQKKSSCLGLLDPDFEMKKEDLREKLKKIDAIKDPKIHQEIRDQVQKIFSQNLDQMSELYRHNPVLFDHASIRETERRNEHQWRYHQEQRFVHARACLQNLFLLPSHNWQWIKEHVHGDNLIILMKIVFDGAPMDQRPRLVDSWVQAQWIKERHQHLFR